jgi:hypothetical protein
MGEFPERRKNVNTPVKTMAITHRSTTETDISYPNTVQILNIQKYVCIRQLGKIIKVRVDVTLF